MEEKGFLGVTKVKCGNCGKIFEPAKELTYANRENIAETECRYCGYGNLLEQFSNKRSLQAE